MINNVQFVNNIEEERIGSEVDEKNLTVLFKEFGYMVEPYRDQGLQVRCFYCYIQSTVFI
jgi:DNA repair photolyase